MKSNLIGENESHVFSIHLASLDVPSLIDENEENIMKLLESIGVSAKID